MKKLIVNLTPTGMIPTKEMTPFVPVSPREIIEDVLHCADLGISMVHLHARDSDGIPAYQKEIYAEIIHGIRSQIEDIVICVSTSGRTFKTFEERSDVLQLQDELKPDMASLTLGSLNFNKIESISSPSMIMRLAECMQERGIKPELEVFDLGMVNFAQYLIGKGLLEPPYYFNIILGNTSSAQAKLSHINLIVSELPENSFWSLGGIGNYQLNVNALGSIFADGIRIGLEDNIWFDEARTIKATNPMLLERILKIADTLGRSVATPDEVRKMLCLSKTKGREKNV